MQHAIQTIQDSKFHNVLHLESNNYYWYIGASRGKILQRILKQKFYLEMSALTIHPRNHKIFEIFDKIIQELESSGHIKLYRLLFSMMENPKYYERGIPIEGPKILTMEDLKAGFVIWLISLVISIIAFIFEWIIRSGEHIIWRLIMSSFYELRYLRKTNVVSGPKIKLTKNWVE